MKRLTSIVATTHEGVIGIDSGLPWRLASDLAFFKKETTGAAVVMGRKTFDSLNRRPLPERHNIVLSHNKDLTLNDQNVSVAYSIEEALALMGKPSAPWDEAFIIGGATMYQQFSSFVDRYLVTMVDKQINGDTKIDLALISNESEWSERVISHYPANPPRDEVSFSIFELTRLRKRDASDRRRLAIIQYKARYQRKKVVRRTAASYSTATVPLL